MERETSTVSDVVDKWWYLQSVIHHFQTHTLSVQSPEWSLSLWKKECSVYVPFRAEGFFLNYYRRVLSVQNVTGKYNHWILFGTGKITDIGILHMTEFHFPYHHYCSAEPSPLVASLWHGGSHTMPVAWFLDITCALRQERINCFFFEWETDNFFLLISSW